MLSACFRASHISHKSEMGVIYNLAFTKGVLFWGEGGGGGREEGWLMYRHTCTWP